MSLHALTQHLIDAGGSPDAGELAHFFAPGVYVRRLDMPAGLTGVSKVHAREHIVIVARGKLALRCESDEQGRTVCAGDVWVSQPGDPRAWHALEDATIITVHHNVGDGRDLELIEKQHIAGDGLTAPQREALTACRG